MSLHELTSRPSVLLYQSRAKVRPRDLLLAHEFDERTTDIANQIGG